MSNINRLHILLAGHLIRGSVLLLAVFATLTWLDFPLLISQHLPSGDLAADMLVGNDLVSQGYLLHGHYSRWGFNHPGPFWFYWNHLFEILLDGGSLSRHQIWQTGSLVANALLISVGSATLSRYLLGQFSLGLALFIAFVILAFGGYEMSGLWMPWRIVTPYFCFLVMVLWSAEGRPWALPIAAFFSGILIHGYITMPIFTLPFLAAGVWWGHKKTSFLGEPQSQRALLLSGLVLIVFAAPILVDLVVSQPSNLSRIFNAQGVMLLAPKPQLLELLRFLGGVLRWDEAPTAWRGGGLILLLVVGLEGRRALEQPRVRRLLILCISVTFLVIVYYARTPSPLFPFIAQFYLVVPMLMLSALFARLIQQGRESENEGARGRSRPGFRWLALGLFIGIVVSGLRQPAAPESGAIVQAFADAMTTHAPDKKVIFHQNHHDDWPLVAGILVELERRGFKACVTRPDFQVLYTPSHVCSFEAFPRFELIDEGACDSNCLARAQGHALRPFELSAMAAGESFFLETGRKALFLGWSEPEGGIRWSLGTKASMIVNIPDPSRFEGKVDIMGKSRGSQRMKIAWNGRTLYAAAGELRSQGLSLAIPKDGIQPGYNVLSFDLPDAKMPGNGDLRVLALRLKEIRIQ